MASDPNEGGAAPAATAPRGGGNGLFNIARGAKLLALLCFFLPWVTVSCAGQPLITMSGYQLATGGASPAGALAGGMGPMGNVAQATPVETAPAGNTTGATPGEGRAPDMWVIAAGALILVSLALTFVLGKALAGLVAGLGSAVAAGLIGYTVLARIPAEVRADMASNPAAGGGAGGAGGSPADMGMNAQQVAEMIRVDPQMGFWLVMAALVAAIVLNLMARSRAGP